MKKHTLILSIAIMLVFAVELPQVAAAAEASKGEESVKVTILKNKPVGISPDTLTVKSGETIVWVNKDAEPVKIKFKTAIGEAGRVPVNFYADLLGNYETGKIHQGSSASICIDNPGTYDYEVRRLVKKGAKEPYEEISDGRIIVQ